MSADRPETEDGAPQHGEPLAMDLARELLQSAPDAMVLVDEAGRIVFANRQTETIFGHSQEELLDATVEVLIPDRFRPQHARHRSGFAAEAQLRPMGTGLELFGLRKDGSEFPVEISLSPLATAEGILTAAAIRDVTDRKELEKELREARTSAEAASLTKTRFLAAASHDLRQPLQAALLYSGVLANSEGEAAVEVRGKLERSLSSLRQLLNKLLDISKLDSGGVEAEPMRVSLGLLFERLQDELGPTARAKGLELRVVSTRLTIRTDPQLFDQLLRNLLSNAIRYTERGRVLLGCRRRGTRVSIEVWDTGVGIADDELETIFSEFYQVEDDRPEAKQGLGLGLAIVRRLADLLDHEIHVRSTPGRGSVFSALAPLALADKLDGDVAEEETREAQQARIVLIEDDEDVRDGCRLSFESAGHQVVAAEGVESAIASLEGADTPDVIVTDYQLLRGETGAQAIEKLRKRFDHTIPAILLTGTASLDAARAAKGADVQMLQKPVDPDRLHDLIQTLLDD